MDLNLRTEAEPTLRELGERGDIIKAMHRALEREGLAEDRHPTRYVLHPAFEQGRAISTSSSSLPSGAGPGGGG